MTGMFVELLKQSVDMIRLRDAIVKKKIVIQEIDLLDTSISPLSTKSSNSVVPLPSTSHDERQSLYRTLHLIYFV